jgi:hypothetical protein
VNAAGMASRPAELRATWPVEKWSSKKMACADDTATGEVARTRIAPADRQAVRRFLARFGGRQLEVALEATTGWRFVVEELAAVGAVAHLAEAAQTSALRGNKKQKRVRDRQRGSRVPLSSRSGAWRCALTTQLLGRGERRATRRSRTGSGLTVMSAAPEGTCSSCRLCPPRASSHEHNGHRHEP